MKVYTASLGFLLNIAKYADGAKEFNPRVHCLHVKAQGLVYNTPY